MKKTDKPKPCPFCGKNPTGTYYVDSTNGFISVFCGNPCFCRGPERRTEKGAVSAWNRRQNYDYS